MFGEKKKKPPYIFFWNCSFLHKDKGETDKTIAVLLQPVSGSASSIKLYEQKSTESLDKPYKPLLWLWARIPGFLNIIWVIPPAATRCSVCHLAEMLLLFPCCLLLPTTIWSLFPPFSPEFSPAWAAFSLRTCFVVQSRFLIPNAASKSQKSASVSSAPQ